MPGLVYLSQSGKQIAAVDWQVWVIIGEVIIGIVFVIAVIWKTRKW